ncbi:MAG: FKBP-type peptidyl-prolyl cis-trans isomerase, partial [Treponema sp.]|nr:FKBP-type peptidyl-prolyl cis-trans isomerase [Treponema sp.]
DADQDVVNAVAQGDEIKSVKIIRQGADAEAFKAGQAEWDAYAKESAAKAMAAKEAKYAAKIAEVEKKFPGFDKTIEGIYYKVTKAGSGAKCGKGKHVFVAYKGYLVDGTVFDQSAGRGDLEFTTGAGQMIPGFDTMVQDMQKGESRTIVLPPDQAYGERGYPGVIPESSYIAFDVTLNRF